MFDERTAKIAELNDELRTTFKGIVHMTGGIFKRPDRDVILDAVKKFDDWTSHSDVYRERDFAAFVIPSEANIQLHPEDVPKDEICIVKIDYYDRDMEYGSEDPSDPEVTVRVMTIMLASEY